MSQTYIIIDSRGRATLHGAKAIQQEATTRLGSGDAFQVFEATPLSVSITLRESGTPTTTRGKKPGRKPGRKKTSRRKSARKAGKKTGKKTGKVGRPRVNVGSCTQDGCNKPAKTRGLCSAHYQQHRRLAQAGKSGLITGGVTRKKRRGRPAGKKKSKKKSARKATKKK